MNLAAALATSGWMHDGELAWLAERAAEAQTIIEVGCWKGRSTLALADNTPGVVYAVDHWQGSTGDPHLTEVAALGGPDGLYATFLANMGSRVQAGAGKVVPLRMSAVEAALTMFAPQSVDLVFIDASHLRDDVRRDIALYRPLVRPGGILCGHDYNIREHMGVTEAVDEAFPQAQRTALSIWWVRL
jgi:predicted O-methyltransferase YrrM